MLSGLWPRNIKAELSFEILSRTKGKVNLTPVLFPEISNQTGNRLIEKSKYGLIIREKVLSPSWPPLRR